MDPPLSSLVLYLDLSLIDVQKDIKSHDPSARKRITQGGTHGGGNPNT